MLAKRSWDFGYVNTAARASSDPYFDFVSFTEIKRWPKKNQQKPNNTKSNFGQQYEC